MKSSIPAWQKQKKLMQNESALVTELLKDPKIVQALKKYVNSFNLQGQVNQGSMSPDQAIQQFYDKGREFLDVLVKSVQSNIRKQMEMPDPNNNPETAFANPDSLLSKIAAEKFFSDIMQSDHQLNNVISDMLNEAADLIRGDSNYQEAASSSPTLSVSDDSHTHADHDVEKDGALLAGLKAIGDHDKEGLEKEFEKFTGIKGGKLNLLSDAEQLLEKNDGLQPTPKPPVNWEQKEKE